MHPGRHSAPPIPQAPPLVQGHIQEPRRLSLADLQRVCGDNPNITWREDLPPPLPPNDDDDDNDDQLSDVSVATQEPEPETDVEETEEEVHDNSCCYCTENIDSFRGPIKYVALGLGIIAGLMAFVLITAL